MMAMVAFDARTTLRGRASIVAILGFAAAMFVVTLLGIDSFRQIGLGAVGPAAVALLDLSLLLPTAIGALLGALTVASGRESGTWAMVRARGLPAAGLVVAAWLAVTCVTWVAIVAGFGVAALVIAGNVPIADMATFGLVLVVALLASAIATAIGVLVGVAVHTRLQAALVALAAWFVLAVGLDLAVIGLGVFLRTGEPGLLAAALIDPFQAARMIALLALDGSGAALGPIGAYLLLRLGSVLAGAAGVTILVAWIVLPLLAATVLVRRRDL